MLILKQYLRRGWCVSFFLNHASIHVKETKISQRFWKFYILIYGIILQRTESIEILWKTVYIFNFCCQIDFFPKEFTCVIFERKTFNMWPLRRKKSLWYNKTNYCCVRFKRRWHCNPIFFYLCFESLETQNDCKEKLTELYDLELPISDKLILRF